MCLIFTKVVGKIIVLTKPHFFQLRLISQLEEENNLLQLLKIKFDMKG
jgi:hypothetical protein